MSEIDREQVRHVARLARLELSDEEVERLTEELGRVLSRFRELEAAEAAEAPEAEDDGAGTGAGAGPAEEASAGGSGLRPDRPDADRLARGPAELAPEWEDGFFLVPRLEALGGATDAAGDAAGDDAGDSGWGGG